MSIWDDLKPFRYQLRDAQAQWQRMFDEWTLAQAEGRRSAVGNPYLIMMDARFAGRRWDRAYEAFKRDYQPSPHVHRALVTRPRPRPWMGDPRLVQEDS